MTNESSKNMPAYLPNYLGNYKGNEFLPNLCESQSLFLLVLVAELIALLICISSSGLPNLDWDEFAMASVVVEYLAGRCSTLPVASKIGADDAGQGGEFIHRRNTADQFIPVDIRTIDLYICCRINYH
jgi:hypothetical protein